jgi:hypothetical protein
VLGPTIVHTVADGCLVFASYNMDMTGRVVMATDGQTRPSVTSDKARVRHIRVNGMLTSKRVKPELLCPRWLPHRCHVGSLAITL